MRRTWIVLFSIIAMQFVWAAEKPIADVFTRSASAPVTNVKSSEPQHFVGHYDMPPLPLARDTFATYAYSYGDIVIFSYADSNECEIIDSAGNKIWSGLLMLDEYRLQKGITPGVYMIQASKAFTVLSGDPFTTGICNWTAVDQNSSPLSTKMLSVGPSRSEGVPVIAVFAYQDSTYVTVRNLDNQTIIWEGYLDSAKYYLREQGEVPPIVYSVEASKPVYTMTGGGLGGKYIPSYDGTFVGRDFITYQQLWRAGEAHDLQIIPWEDKTTVSVVDLNNPLDTIWREFFSKKGEVKGQRIPLPGTGRALYIHSDKDISLSENPWVSFGPSSSIGFFLIRSIDRNGLGIGTEFHQPLEGSVSWSTPYVYSRLLVVAYSDNTDVTITRTPRYGGADEPVWKGKLSRGQYYRYTCPLDDVNAWATYHVTSSEGVSVIGNCRDTEGSDFLPLWFAIHPGVLVLPSPQYKETECGVPTSESNSGAYLTIIRNTGNIADLMNIELTN
ncbi:hypothetical protein GX441_09810, partial [bacterium]|nr:hypothetical protein [bacterium]